MSVQMKCAMVFVVAALVGGCGQKGLLYREAVPTAVPVADQGKQDSAPESDEASASQ